MNSFRGLYMGVVFFVLAVSLVAQDPFTIKDPYPGDKYTSNGVAWGDWNNDGYQDVFVGNGAAGYKFEDFLYKNNGDGTFTKITGQAITDDVHLTGGANWGDYDEDGDLDIYVSLTEDSFGGNDYYNFLFINDGAGNFTKSTTAGPPIDEGEHSNVGGFGDYDNNATLDIFQKNGWQGFKREHSLYSNDGDGTFTEIDAGDMTGSTSSAFISGFSACDFDMDGDLDIFICSGGLVDNWLYRNDGSNTFVSVGAFTGNFSNGCSWGDIDNDGDFDLFIANYGDAEKEENDLYLNNGDGSFTKNTTSIVVTEPSWSMGSAFGDIDNDGDLDLFVANDYQYDSNPNFLYINNGDGTFTKNTTTVAATDPMSQAPHGVAFADYDNNGFIDLFAAVHGPNFFLENNAPNSGNTNNWILINLTGTTSTKTAIGAKVWATATIGGTQVTQLRQVAAQTGMASNNSYRVHFGFGDATVISELKIEFLPVSLAKTSTLITYTNVQTNQILNIEESTPIAVELISFQATPLDNGMVNLSWTTAQESNNAGFYVQKSTARHTGFKRVHKNLIMSKGSTTSGHAYAYQDQLSEAADAFYRLEHISYDGMSTFSKTISVSAASGADRSTPKPSQFSLAQNYPNPFNPATTIAYELAAPSTVQLSIYDVTGRRIRILYDSSQEAGAYKVEWDGFDQSGQPVGSGVYFCTLKTDTWSATRKMILAR